MISTILVLTLAAAPFPLPTVDGKALAITEKQREFKLPMRFDKVRAFYEEQFKARGDLKQSVKGTTGQRVVTWSSRSKDDTWTRATIKEGDTLTVVEVVTVLQMGPLDVDGNGKPMVQFVFGRSSEVDKSLESIDHTESIRR